MNRAIKSCVSFAMVALAGTLCAGQVSALERPAGAQGGTTSEVKSDKAVKPTPAAKVKETSPEDNRYLQLSDEAKARPDWEKLNKPEESGSYPKTSEKGGFPESRHGRSALSRKSVIE